MSDQHADAGGKESGVIAIVDCQGSGHQGRKQSSYVDTHVEEGEPLVSAEVCRTVQLPYDGGDVRFEEPVADDQQDQTCHQ